MGYRPAHQTYTIEFEQYPGLVVRTLSTSLGKLMSVLTAPTDISRLSVEEARQHPAFTMFADAIVEWNVEHPDIPLDRIPTPEELASGEGIACPLCGLKAGAPLPSSVDGMFCLDLDFVMDLIMGWVTALTRVSQGKAMNLKNGGTPQQEMMQQLNALASPVKLPTPN